jgi:hypothetical protein
MTHPAEPVVVSEDASRISSLFDIRLLIGGLLTLYGVILIVRGLLDGSKALDKADGIRINLWTGIGLLVGGLLFLLWRQLRPLEPLKPGEALDAGIEPEDS